MTKQLQPYHTLGVISSAQEGYADPTLHVATVELLVL